MYKKMYLFLQSSIGKPGRLQHLLHYDIGHLLHIVFLPGHCVVERDVKEAEEKDKNAKFFSGQNRTRSVGLQWLASPSVRHSSSGGGSL